MTFLLLVTYIAFIGLGLPDTILGAAWPLMFGEFRVPISVVSAVSIVISFGTILSSLFSVSVLRRFGTGKVVLASVLLTAVALLGYSVSGEFWLLCLFAVPLGIGGGSIDVALNNYAALHFRPLHMHWLHASWGVGATLGPAVLSGVLCLGFAWRAAYIVVAGLLFGIALLMVFALPLWRRASEQEGASRAELPGIRKALSIPGMRFAMLSFFAYTCLENTSGLWCASYLTQTRGFAPERAAAVVSILFMMLMVGRVLNGALSVKVSNRTLLRFGFALVLLGILALLSPLDPTFGVALVGLGLAPGYPTLVHETPKNFGEAVSERALGLQMASSYVAAITVPPLFGALAGCFSLALFPPCLAAFWSLFVFARLGLGWRVGRSASASR